MTYYCKGYRLKMRPILSALALCLLFAVLGGMACRFDHVDRSEEIEQLRADNLELQQAIEGDPMTLKESSRKRRSGGGSGD